MGVPAYARTWQQKLTTGTPGARITFVSLIDTMQNYIYGLKTFLLANSCTVLWSASAGTGPTNSSDHTDRISSASTWTPRATIAGASQAWVVLTDGNAGQLLITYQGASDDICRISYSPGALFALAGTTNQQPTATDEIVLTTAVTVVNATASADRVWHGWATSDGKNYRFTIFRSSAVAGPSWGVELITLPSSVPGNVSFTPAAGVWAFCFSSAKLTASVSNGLFQTFAASSEGGYVRCTISSVAFTAQCTMCTWCFGSNPASAVLTSQPALQGAGFDPFPCAIFSNTSGADGYAGMLVDWWTSAPSGVAQGDGFGSSYDWVQMGGALWPNPSLTAPTIT